MITKKMLLTVAAFVSSLLIFTGCSEAPPEEDAKAETPKLQAPKKVVRETPTADVAETSSSDDGGGEGRERRDGDRRGFGGKGDGKGFADWRNMTPEEREERRRQFIADMDKNGDGNLGKDEVPERMWEFMSRADKDGDNIVTAAEREEHRAEREAERAMRELSGEEPEGGRFGGGRGFGGKGGGGKGGFGGGNRDAGAPSDN